MLSRDVKKDCVRIVNHCAKEKLVLNQEEQPRLAQTTLSTIKGRAETIVKNQLEKVLHTKTTVMKGKIKSPLKLEKNCAPNRQCET